MFKLLDTDFDGIISKEEIVEAFHQVGVDASIEINAIMNNLDIDKNGHLDFTEIKISLVDWEKEIKKKVLRKAFKEEDTGIALQDLKQKFPDVLAHEWSEFLKKTKSDGVKISLASLKEYIKEELV